MCHEKNMWIPSVSLCSVRILLSVFLALQATWFLHDVGCLCNSVSTGFDWTTAWNTPQVL